MSIFTRDSSTGTSELLGLLDSFYRIEEAEFQRLLESRFGIRVIASSHEFKIAPDKSGALGRIFPFEDIGKHQLPNRRVFDRPPITISTADDKCLYSYKTPTQEFRILFSGAEAHIDRWSEILRANAVLAAPMFLYLFNRKRAADVLQAEAEAERQFIRDTFLNLRDAAGHRPLSFD